MLVVAITVAGVAGALARHGVDRGLHRLRPTWSSTPILLVNLTGSLLLGLLTGLLAGHAAADPLLAVLGTGFCGSYTTFGTASHRTVTLLRERRRAAAAGHLAGTLLGCVAAAAAGLLLGTALAG